MAKKNRRVKAITKTYIKSYKGETVHVISKSDGYYTLGIPPQAPGHAPREIVVSAEHVKNQTPKSKMEEQLNAVFPNRRRHPAKQKARGKHRRRSPGNRAGRGGVQPDR